ncbi:Gfo/Idh/MocA family oxidoreductase [Fontisphaera persica]|uniref:Gfo/Idh/MocA family protein n=1 Tax=Fontisphaera persica TaxID=2974023 RepID=UPI0024C09FF1|nr:Gfo/Idh/MocA family oxidoreductase [Fontisphaera persica]WCJ58376.1 Gfo/Idh/MocA family oxidoreductase [Fontisphaera persica]
MSKFYKVYGAASAQSRRNFLKYTGLATGALLAAPSFLRAQNVNSRIRVACIGVGGKGDSDANSAANKEWGGDIVAICDVDRRRLESKAKQFPNAKQYKDFRKMLEEMEKEIDAVTISTPDHVHGLATVMALKMKKHVYTQKPLVQTVHEARIVRQLVQKNPNLATQMGNQGSAESGLRRAVEVIQAGVIGPVRELHVWSNRPIWPQGIPRPEGEDPVPDWLDWDLWLGPAQFRPYKRDVYHAFNWRGWYDFGTGALGDMACHTVNMPFRALKLGYPSVIECEETSQLFPETFPKTSRIRFEFPKREDMVPLKFWWYDGNPGDKNTPALRPPAELTKDIVALRGSLPGSGCLLVGDKGQIFSPDDYGARFYIKLKDEAEFKSGSDHEACKAVPQTIPRSPGHDREWFEMMRDPKKKAYSNFDIAAYLTEIILLGCIALRHGVKKPIQWDGKAARARNAKVEHLVKRDYRKGWELPAV